MGSNGPATIAITNGYFSAMIDFGGVFTGTNYWLEISVQSGAGPIYTLSPRQPINSVPYAQKASFAQTVAGPIPLSIVSGAGALAWMNSPLNVSNGGTGSTAARAAGQNIGIYEMSPVGGNNAFNDMLSATPSFEGQIGVSYYGTRAPFLWSSGSTATGDWKRGWNFPAGIFVVGDPQYSDPQLNSSIWELNGSAAGWNRAGDSMFIVRNWSSSSNNSGSGIGVAVMGVDTNTGRAVMTDLVGAGFNHVPVNRVPGLIPGHAMLVFNADRVNLKGFAIASPGASGFDPGNYSYNFSDFIGHLWGVPLWVANAYQPADAGWQWALTVNPASGNVAIPNGDLTAKSTHFSKEVLPHLTRAQRDAIANPESGQAIFQTDNTPGLRVYNGTNWVRYTEISD